MADIQVRKNLSVNLAACHPAKCEAAGPEILGEFGTKRGHGEELLRRLILKKIAAIPRISEMLPFIRHRWRRLNRLMLRCASSRIIVLLVNKNLNKQISAF